MREYDKITISPKKYFAGGNTARGFVSRFDHITPPRAEPHYTYIIKGGPGVGKSTLMRKLGQKAMELGYMTEEFYCSGDPDSLDAIRIPGKRLILLDGTAPHTIDPKIPGAGDEILNLGCFKNQKELTSRLPEIEGIFKENSHHYSLAYALLSAAGKLKQSAMDSLGQRVSKPLIHSYIRDFMGRDSPSESQPRRLFISAISHKGIVDFNPYTLGCDMSISVGGPLGGIFMGEVEKLLNGRRAEIFSDRLLPYIPESIHLPEVKLSFIMSGHNSPDIDTSEFFDRKLSSFEEFNLAESERLVMRAVSQLKKAKEAHDRLEQTYRSYVDFDRVNALSDELLKKIFG